jgi:hypothetical protein
MSCFKYSLCTEEREREGWSDWKREKGEGGEGEIGGVAEMERGKRERGESGEGRIGGVAGMESEKREREREGGGWKCRVMLGYLLFRFSFLLYFFLDSIKPVQFGPVQSV